MPADRPGPLVSVVTPVYNGEEHLPECVQSVLAQTWPDFEYTIVNNCSTDRTREIAEEFAARDNRIRVHNNVEFLDVVSSINKAFTLISPDSTYCKLVAADDWLFPRCIEEMVKLAQQHPSVGMVTSYVLSGSRVTWDGLPYGSAVMDGREICRKRFLDSLKIFGGPSASMIRSGILRTQVPFYRVGNYSGDNEAYLELLKHNDFGFVHQVLSYRRLGEASRTTSYLRRVRSYPIADIEEVLHFGEHYLSEQEYSRLIRRKLRSYYRFLAQAIFDFEKKEFWDYHLQKMSDLKIPISYTRLGWHVALKLLDLAFNPKRTLESAYQKLVQR
ncbi:MAG TPA: glycosyltransferase family 2 protein [Woeseiaceae bacterium]|jgi:glycosyltransferase involved in cell wall biosynthesis|nr:glycosyltransferase family 2 protein [Woeseiaceae bacterium]